MNTVGRLQFVSGRRFEQHTARSWVGTGTRVRAVGPVHALDVDQRGTADLRALCGAVVSVDMPPTWPPTRRDPEVGVCGACRGAARLYLEG